MRDDVDELRILCTLYIVHIIMLLLFLLAANDTYKKFFIIIK